jgi:hypothetical protein
MITHIGIPKRAFYVRKRWDGGGVYLVHLTDIVQIDSFTEAVWDRLDGNTDFDEITLHITNKFPEIDPIVIEAMISQIIIFFANRNYLQLNRGTFEE